MWMWRVAAQASGSARNSALEVAVCRVGNRTLESVVDGSGPNFREFPLMGDPRLFLSL
jgi:hypothetical protein